MVHECYIASLLYVRIISLSKPLLRSAWRQVLDLYSVLVYRVYTAVPHLLTETP